MILFLYKCQPVSWSAGHQIQRLTLAAVPWGPRALIYTAEGLKHTHSQILPTYLVLVIILTLGTRREKKCTIEVSKHIKYIRHKAKKQSSRGWYRSKGQCIYEWPGRVSFQASEYNLRKWVMWISLCQKFPSQGTARENEAYAGGMHDVCVKNNSKVAERKGATWSLKTMR